MAALQKLKRNLITRDHEVRWNMRQGVDAQDCGRELNVVTVLFVR